jgi:enamine deaminase RidA (YjgF/YER057c/UK114 family)
MIHSLPAGSALGGTAPITLICMRIRDRLSVRLSAQIGGAVCPAVDGARLAPRTSSLCAARRSDLDAGGSGVMSVTLMHSARLYPGAPYAYAAVDERSGLVVTAGACPLDADGQITAAGDVAGQARAALANLAIALEEAGAALQDVLKTTVYVASGDRADLVTAWNEVAAYFGDHDAPSTLLGVAVLGYPGQLVEIEAIAALPGRHPESQ